MTSALPIPPLSLISRTAPAQAGPSTQPQPGPAAPPDPSTGAGPGPRLFGPSRGHVLSRARGNANNNNNQRPGEELVGNDDPLVLRHGDDPQNTWMKIQTLGLLQFRLGMFTQMVQDVDNSANDTGRLWGDSVKILG